MKDCIRPSGNLLRLWNVKNLHSFSRIWADTSLNLLLLKSSIVYVVVVKPVCVQTYDTVDTAWTDLMVKWWSWPRNQMSKCLVMPLNIALTSLMDDHVVRRVWTLGLKPYNVAHGVGLDSNFFAKMFILGSDLKRKFKVYETCFRQFFALKRYLEF